MSGIPSRKRRRIVLSIVLSAALLLGVGAAVFLSAPEYALLRIYGDIKKDGIIGVRPHLGEEALRDFDAIEAITEDELVGAIIALFGQDDYMRLVKAHLPDLTWDFNGVEREGGGAHVSLGFKYKESFAGSLELVMEKTDGRWLITSVHIENITKTT